MKRLDRSADQISLKIVLSCEGSTSTFIELGNGPNVPIFGIVCRPSGIWKYYPNRQISRLTAPRRRTYKQSSRKDRCPQPPGNDTELLGKRISKLLARSGGPVRGMACKVTAPAKGKESSDAETFDYPGARASWNGAVRRRAGPFPTGPGLQPCRRIRQRTTGCQRQICGRIPSYNDNNPDSSAFHASSRQGARAVGGPTAPPPRDRHCGCGQSLTTLVILG
jgi:hypothetical protein